MQLLILYDLIAIGVNGKMSGGLNTSDANCTVRRYYCKALYQSLIFPGFWADETCDSASVFVWSIWTGVKYHHINEHSGKLT